jgi:ferredoxin
MLYIDPSECIDCDACVAACPVGAPVPEELLPEAWKDYARINVEYFSSH